MISRVITRLAPPAVALTLITLIPTAVLMARLGLLTDAIVLATFVLTLSYLAAGLLITLRRIGNPIGWLLLWSGVLAGLNSLAVAYGMYDLHQRAGSLPGASVLLWASSWVWLAAPATSPLTHVLFPDGRLLSSRWAWVIWLAVASMALVMVATAAAGWPLRGPALLEGPSWGPEVYPLPPLAQLGLLLFGVAEAGSLTAMVIRLRRSRGISGNRSSGSCTPGSW